MLRKFLPTKQTGWTAAVRNGDAIEVVRVCRSAGARPRVTATRTLDAYTANPAACLAGARTRELAGGPFTFLLQQDEYQLLQIDTPDVPEAEQRNALRWQLKDMLHQSAEDSVFDALPIAPPASSRGRPPSLVVAAARQTLAPTVRAFQAARLDLAAIDIPELALRNLAVLHDTAPRGVALLHFGASGGLVVVCHDGELVTSRRFDVTADQLTHSDDLHSTRFERIGLELQRSLDNFDRQYGHVPLAKLLVSVPPCADSLIDFLASNLYIPVEPLDPGALVDDFENASGSTLLALGAALRGPKP
jgi:MSHA biogenesis protein MshI